MDGKKQFYITLISEKRKKKSKENNLILLTLESTCMNLSVLCLSSELTFETFFPAVGLFFLTKST